MEEIKKKKSYNSNNMASMSSTTSPDKSSREELITISTTSPPWKLYENPVYNSHQNQNQQNNIQTIATKNNHIQCLQLPLSARRLAASFWDLSFFRPAMSAYQDDLGSARAQITDLKSELEYERKARKKLESMNKRLAKEAGEERRRREAMERMCEDLAREISLDKSEIAKMKTDMEEERKMMRVSEVLREERVQMKLADAKIALEEKLLDLDTQLGFRKSQRMVVVDSLESMRSLLSDHDQIEQNDHDHSHNNNTIISNSNSNTSTSTSTRNSLPIFQRKLVSPEIENPHIKRGIKGFVEFPRVVRAIGTRNRQWGTKLECQKAQLRILLRQNGPIRSSSIIS